MKSISEEYVGFSQCAKVKVKKGVKLTKEKVRYPDSFGNPIHEIWRKCPHGKFHPKDLGYDGSFIELRNVKRNLCKHGCFSVTIEL